MKLTRSFRRQKPLSHELRGEWVSERANERTEKWMTRYSTRRFHMISNHCATLSFQRHKPLSHELRSEWASERANERTEERMAQYSSRRFRSHSTQYPLVPRQRTLLTLPLLTPLPTLPTLLTLPTRNSWPLPRKSAERWMPAPPMSKSGKRPSWKSRR